MKVKQATTPEEEALCREIRRRVFTEEQGVPEELEVDEYEGESTHFLAYLDEAPVATGRFRLHGPYVKFERIAALQEMRGRGAAKALMLAMQREAQQRYPGRELMLYAQVSALLFYQKLGWVAEGEPFDDAGIMHLKMIYAPR